MAIQISNFISGKIDNVVFYKLGGAYIARSKPATVKQTEATRLRSRNFGVAATAGKVLRQSLLPVLPFPKDKNMQGRFSGAIAQWLKLQHPASIPATTDIPFVNGFDFNTATSVAERWKVMITVAQPEPGRLELQIPGFIPTAVIAAPAYTASVQCSIATACCGLATGEVSGSFSAAWQIPYADIWEPAKTISIPVAAGPGQLMVTALSLTYLPGSGQAETRSAFMPSSVIDARYS